MTERCILNTGLTLMLKSLYFGSIYYLCDIGNFLSLQKFLMWKQLDILDDMQHSKKSVGEPVIKLQDQKFLPNPSNPDLWQTPVDQGGIPHKLQLCSMVLDLWAKVQKPIFCKIITYNTTIFPLKNIPKNMYYFNLVFFYIRLRTNYSWLERL